MKVIFNPIFTCVLWVKKEVQLCRPQKQGNFLLSRWSSICVAFEHVTLTKRGYTFFFLLNFLISTFVWSFYCRWNLMVLQVKYLSYKWFSNVASEWWNLSFSSLHSSHWFGSFWITGFVSLFLWNVKSIYRCVVYLSCQWNCATFAFELISRAFFCGKWC